jgi:hypothetical protein
MSTALGAHLDIRHVNEAAALATEYIRGGQLHAHVRHHQQRFWTNTELRTPHEAKVPAMLVPSLTLPNLHNTATTHAKRTMESAGVSRSVCSSLS